MSVKFKKRKVSDEMSLQITSMADIFTIILVFLLKSYSTSATQVAPSAGTRLVEAQGADTAVEALKLEVAEGGIQVEGKPVATLQKFKPDPQDVEASGALRSLASTLKTERERQNLIAAANPDVKSDSKVLIVADQRTPYSTLKNVMASAALHGFSDFKLVVIRRE